MTTAPRSRSWLVSLLRERSFWIALVIWAACAAAIFPLSQGALPFNRPSLARVAVRLQIYAAIFGWFYALIFMG